MQKLDRRDCASSFRTAFFGLKQTKNKTQKKHILCVHQGYELYGSDRSFLSSVKVLRDTYHNAHITVHLPKEGALSLAIRPLCDELVVGDLWVLRRANIGKGFVKSFLRLPVDAYKSWRAMRRAYVVYLNSPLVLSYVLAGRLAGGKRIIHLRDLSVGWEQKILVVLVSIFGGARIVNSKATAKAYHLNPTDKKTHLVYNAVEDSEHVPAPPNRNDGILRLVRIARFNRAKGQEMLVKAVALLSKQDRAKLQLRFVGGVFEDQTHYLDNMKRMVADYDLDDIVFFHSFTQDVAHHIEWADVVVVSSIMPESFGRTIVEGMRASRPVIVSDCGAPPEIVTNEKDGFIYPYQDVSGLTKAIKRYLKQPALIQEHGKAARERYETHFTISRYRDDLIRIFDSEDL